MKKLEQEGDIDLILQFLEDKMFMAANELRFEDVAYLRDKIREIKKDFIPYFFFFKNLNLQHKFI